MQHKALLSSKTAQIDEHTRGQIALPPILLISWKESFRITRKAANVCAEEQASHLIPSFFYPRPETFIVIQIRWNFLWLQYTVKEKKCGISLLKSWNVVSTVDASITWNLLLVADVSHNCLSRSTSRTLGLQSLTCKTVICMSLQSIRFKTLIKGLGLPSQKILHTEATRIHVSPCNFYLRINK
jgi:hypothetical protein